jgi:hypothetical protein
MNRSNLIATSEHFGLRRFVGTWQKRLIVSFILVILGVVVWSQRIKTSYGFLMDDCSHLAYSYENNLRILPYLYLPGVAAHRPIGDDAITLLLRLFGERDPDYLDVASYSRC